MNSNEFGIWSRNHGSLHSGFLKWLESQDSDLIRAWHEGLCDVTLRSAREVSKLIAFGEIDDPGGFGKHLAVVRRHARDMDRDHRDTSYIGGQQVFDCARCQDFGVVSGFHPSRVADVMAGREMLVGLMPCGFACSCSAGIRWSQPPKVGSKTMRALPVFREGKRFSFFCRFSHENRESAFVLFQEGSVDEQVAAIESEIETVYQGMRHGAFDDWNNRADLQ